MRNSRPSLCRRAFVLLAALTPLLGAFERSAIAADEPIFSLSDPEKDDHGDGHLQYPLRTRNDMLPGHLDLVSFAAYREKGGTTFQATFARPIVRPEPVPVNDTGTLMTDVFKLGFYTFNVDVYIDTDGIPGSGSIRLLPGRNAEVEPTHAWEKAICLTPLPYQAEQQLTRTLAEEQRKDAAETRTGSGRLTAEEKKEIKAEVARQTQGSVFFPKRVEVFGPTIRFFVPMSFLGGPARAEWGYLIAVSGASDSGSIDLVKAAGLKKDAPMEPLYIMRVAPGRSENTFGGADEDDPAPCALIDIIVPPGASQEKLLSSSNLRARTLPRLPAVVPSEVTAPARK